MDDQNKNLILATVLSGAVILVWFLLFPPEQPLPTEPGTVAEDLLPGQALTPPTAGSPDLATPQASPVATAPRIDIDTPRLSGSISLTGGRLDDLALKGYRETLDPDSAEVTLLSPVGQEHAYYALYGWAPGGDLAFDQVPGADTPWQLTAGDTLTPSTPVTLSWDNGAGLVFHRTISVDENYLFSISQSVENTGETIQRLAPYGIVARHGEPDGQRFFVLHEGVVRRTDGELQELAYKKMPDLDFLAREQANAEIAQATADGWVGFTDKYWMTTLIPSAGTPFASVVKYVPGADIYQTETRLPTMSVAPGTTVSAETQLFAGAKEWEVIRGYEDAGIHGFVDSIDWGWFFFLTKPIFKLLHNINLLIGNMGWSIIILTVIIKGILFPLAYKSYVSMAKMKELQPEMEKLKEKCGDDKQKLQAAMMELYKTEKVNPAAGCLPILLQIPIFFSLYKVIFVTLELRHAPWVGWIRDLSAPDPSSILNLFGLLPWGVPELTGVVAFISLGILPIFLGISMWLQQKLNPAPPDPAQAMIFAWMPWVFMFMLGNFASGLVIYWIANNTITFIQQYTIMSLHGKPPALFDNILSGFKKKSGD